MKQTVERLRQELSDEQRNYEQLKARMNDVNLRIDECEGKMFSTKNQIDRLRNESEQTKVDLSYSRATVENQREAYEKLHNYYQKQVSLNA